MLKLSFNGQRFDYTKASIRAAFNPLIAAYLANGGTVHHVAAA